MICRVAFEVTERSNVIGEIEHDGTLPIRAFAPNKHDSTRHTGCARKREVAYQQNGVKHVRQRDVHRHRMPG